MRKIFKLTTAICTLTLTALTLYGCDSGYNEEALHVNYDEASVYGSEDYLGSTITIAGSAIENETVYTVEEIERLALDSEELRYQGEYSGLTRGSIFSKHEFTGVKLYEILKLSGLDESDTDINVRFVSVDGYTLAVPLEEVINSTDNVYSDMTATTPDEEGVPMILAFGSDGIPLTGPVGNMKLGAEITEEQGFNEEADNSGGPIMLVAGQKSADEFNSPDNAKWLRQIIVGEDDNAEAHAKALDAEQALRFNDTVKVDPDSGMWTHASAPYDKYLSTKVKITGSEAKPATYTLAGLEAMTGSAVTDSFGASCGVNGYQGVILRDVVMSNLADGVKTPSKISVIGVDGYETEIDVNDMLEGITSRYQKGEKRDIIIAYSIDGVPLVPDENSEGFNGSNGYGPMRLVVENQTTRWVKQVAKIRIGN
jgi:DMSO/TMAO reductase YedYZ molybdopterin-dependent catalytic subunit